jgi:hypothetical protein
MLVSPTEKYIFDESSRLNFYDKLETFQEYFVDKMLLMGVATNGTSMRNIHFEKNKDHGHLFYQILIEALSTSRPFLIAELIHNNRREMQCCFYDFGVAEGVRYIYMLQNAMDWTSENDFCCQLHSLIEPTQDIINNFWNA